MRASGRLWLKDLPTPFRLLSGALSLCLVLLTLSGWFTVREHRTRDACLEERVQNAAAMIAAAASSSEAATARQQRRVLQAERAATSVSTSTLLVLLAAAGLLIAGAWVIILWQFCYRGESQRRVVGSASRSDLRGLTMLRAFPDTVFLLDEEGVILDYHSPFGGPCLPAVDLLGRRIAEVVRDDMAARIMGALKKAFHTGVVQHCEYRLPGSRDQDDYEQRYEVRVVPCGTGEAIAVARDVTDQPHSERRSRETETKFRILVEQSLTGIYIIQNGRFSYVNPRFAELLGYTTRELLALDDLTVLVVPDDRPLLREQLLESERNRPEGWSTRFNVRGVRRDATVIYGETYASVANYYGAPAVIGTLLDVTEQREAQEKLRVLFLAVEQSAEGVLVIDPNGIVRFVNPAWTRMHGYTVEEVTGQHFRIFHTEEQMRREVFPVIHRFEGSGVYRAEMGHKRKDGSTFPSTTAFASIRDEEHGVLGAVAICRDITEQKQYEAELVEAKERAEEVSRMKSAFLTNMSHEIRTPLTGIIGFAKVLEEEVQDEQKEFAQMIEVSGDRLMQTLNAIMDLARLEAGEMVVEPRSVQLCDEVHEAARMFRLLATEKGLDFEVYCSAEEIQAYIDPNALNMILNNLLANAIKFTNRGSVTIEVSVQEADVTLAVRDTGVGIDETFLPHLFDEFKQESVGLTRSHEGSGLGLAITRRLVELMGGTIAVESEKGVGSRFVVALPRAAPEHESKSGAEQTVAP